MELLRSAPRKRRKRSSEHVVHPAIRARFFNGHDVLRFFDHADCLLAASRTYAVQARIRIRDVTADRARADFFFGVTDGVRQSQGILGRRAKQMKRQALGGLLANSGEMLQLIDESFDGSGKIGHAACVAYPRASAQNALRW